MHYGRTDRPSYRDARTHLKITYNKKERFKPKELDVKWQRVSVSHWSVIGQLSVSGNRCMVPHWLFQAIFETFSIAGCIKWHYKLVSDVQLAKIRNSVWLPFGIMILVKVGYDLAPGGIVDTIHLAV